MTGKRLIIRKCMKRKKKSHKPKIPLEELFIDTKRYEELCGREYLNVIDARRRIIGNLKMTISCVHENGKHQFVIHSSSNVTVNYNNNSDGRPSTFNMSFTSRIEPDYTTLEEFRNETSYDKNTECKRTLHLIRDKKTYQISVTHKKGSEVIMKSEPLSPDAFHGFLSEGANILLLKYMGILQRFGKVRTQSMPINGDICRSQIYSLPEIYRTQHKGRRAALITRTIKGLNRTIQKMYTWVDYQGKILCHRWPDVGHDWMLEIDKRVQLDKPLLSYIPLYETWEEDIQLTSIYIDEVKRLLSSYRSYMLDYPEFEQLLADFVLQVVLDRPNDTVKYAVDFFTSYLPSHSAKLNS